MTHMKNSIYIIAILLAGILYHTGCTDKISEKGKEDSGIYTFTVEEDLRGFDYGTTKGILSDIYCTDENGIGNVAIFAYDLTDGRYRTSCHTDNYDGSEPFTLELKDDTPYKIYTIANMGTISAPPDMEDMERYIHTINSWTEMTDMAGFLPMAGATVIDTGLADTFRIFVKRLVAEININYDSPDGLKVFTDSIKICNSPLEVSPFSDNRPSVSGDGDRASQEDIGIFAEGKGIRMFMLENMNYGSATSGELTVQDPDTPAPDNVSWIELKGNITNSAGIISGKIGYRILLDFDIKRNKKYTINFTVTPEGVYEDSWRVEVSDAILDMGNEVIMSQDSSIPYAITAEEYTDITYSTDDIGIVRYHNGRLYSGNPGFATLTARSEQPDAYGSVKITVLSNSEDHIEVDDHEIVLGLPTDIPFIAPKCETLGINTPEGYLEMDVSYDSDGQPRTVEDQYVRIEFDPSLSNNKAFNITVKELKLLAGDKFECTLRSISGKTETFSLTSTIPRLNVRCNDTQVSECGKSTRYYIQLLHNGKALNSHDFDNATYNKYFSRIVGSTGNQDAGHIGFTPDMLTMSGNIYGISANGREPYTGHISFRYNGRLSFNEKGRATCEITVLPAFTAEGGKTEDIDNMVMLNEGDTHILPIPQSDISDAQIEIRHLDWDRQWEKGRNCNDEITAEASEDGMKIRMKDNASGPYALKLTKQSPVTGKVFTCTYYFDIYLNFEVGIHIPWNETGRFSIDIEIIFNINGGDKEILELVDGENREFIRVSQRFGSSYSELYRIGESVRLWGNSDFFYTDPAHASLPPCVNFIDSIIDQFQKRKFVYKIHNPFTDEDESSGSFATGQDISEKFFNGEPILLRFNLAKSFLYTIVHNGCTMQTGYDNGDIETNRN